MKSSAALLFLSMLICFSGCTPKPKPIEFGSDMCHFCKMTIVDIQHAAELVTKKGKVQMFDAIECMVEQYQRSNEGQYALLLVADFNNVDTWVNAKEGFYLISQNLPSPMGANLTAFATESEAKAVLDAKGGKIYSWDALLKYLGRE